MVIEFVRRRRGKGSTNRATIFQASFTHPSRSREEHAIPLRTERGEVARRRLDGIRLEVVSANVGGPCHLGLSSDELATKPRNWILDVHTVVHARPSHFE